MDRVSASIVSIATAATLNIGAVAPASAAEPTQQANASASPALTNTAQAESSSAFPALSSNPLPVLVEMKKGPLAPLADGIILTILAVGFLISLIPGSGITTT